MWLARTLPQYTAYRKIRLGVMVGCGLYVTCSHIASDLSQCHPRVASCHLTSCATDEDHSCGRPEIGELCLPQRYNVRLKSKRPYLPLYKVADTAFWFQANDVFQICLGCVRWQYFTMSSFNFQSCTYPPPPTLLPTCSWTKKNR